jgi:CRISPR/Cas system CSM-associated protein Csm2 small subunit
MEATMRVLSIKELMRLTRVQLIDLYARITNALPDMPEGSENRQIALINLRKIRIVLARHDLTP